MAPTSGSSALGSTRSPVRRPTVSMSAVKHKPRLPPARLSYLRMETKRWRNSGDTRTLRSHREHAPCSPRPCSRASDSRWETVRSS
eukprot:2441698-Alexandrium_andersonii.AAC.1